MQSIKRSSPSLFAVVMVMLVVSFPASVSAQPGTWISRAPMPTARDTEVAELNGMLYAVGGQSANDCTFLNIVEAYEPVTDQWITRASMPTSRVGHGVAVIDGILYAVGGSVGCGPRTGALEAYDPSTNTWTTKAPMPTPRESLVVVAINGILYAVGGGDSVGNALSTVEAYNPATNTWSTKASLPTPRAAAAAAAVNGILYVAGGSNPVLCPAGNVCGDAVEAYDPVNNTWSTVASMRTLRTHSGAGALNGVFYVVDGAFASDLSTVEAYHPGSNSWTSSEPPMPTARRQVAVGMVNGVFYAVGGFTTPTNSWTPANDAFQPNVQFTRFAAKAQIRFGPGANDDNFRVDAHFSLGAGNNGINPPVERVMFAIGRKEFSVPPGSFTPNAGGFAFRGVVDTTTLALLIQPLADGSFRFVASGARADITGTQNSVSINLTIGNDAGSTAVID